LNACLTETQKVYTAANAIMDVMAKPTSSSESQSLGQVLGDAFGDDAHDQSPLFPSAFGGLGCVYSTAMQANSVATDQPYGSDEFLNAANAEPALLACVPQGSSELLSYAHGQPSNPIFRPEDLPVGFASGRSDLDNDVVDDEVADLHEMVFYCAVPMNSAPKWTMLPNISKPTVFIDQVLEGILHHGTQLSPLEITTELSSSVGAAVTGVLSPGVMITKFPLCARVAKWMISDFGKVFSEDFPDFIGLLYVIYAWIRWRVVQTEKSYSDLPEWMKPNHQQIQSPHAMWIDIFPWPKGRAKLVETFKAECFHTFRQICLQTVSVNWRIGPESIIVWCPILKRMSLNPSFEEHISVLDNWTVGPLLQEKFPEMTGLVKQGLQSRILHEMI
jgi:hypothetical protein